MKFSSVLVAASAVMGAAVTHPYAKERCGRLGAMEWDPKDLPAGVTPAQIRMCADHPNGAGNYWGFGKYLPDWVPRNPWA